MNESHGMILQKLDEILNKLDQKTSNQVSNQDVGSQGDVDVVNTEGQPNHSYEYPQFPHLSPKPEWHHGQFMIQPETHLKPQRKPNKIKGTPNLGN